MHFGRGILWSFTTESENLTFFYGQASTATREEDGERKDAEGWARRNTEGGMDEESLEAKDLGSVEYGEVHEEVELATMVSSGIYLSDVFNQSFLLRTVAI